MESMILPVQVMACFFDKRDRRWKTVWATEEEQYVRIFNNASRLIPSESLDPGFKDGVLEDAINIVQFYTATINCKPPMIMYNPMIPKGWDSSMKLSPSVVSFLLTMEEYGLGYQYF